MISTCVATLTVLAAGTVGSGVVKDESRNVAAFHKVRVEQGLQAEVTQGDQTAVIVHGDDNLVGLVRTDVEDGELVIHMTSGSHGFETHSGLKVLVTTRSVDSGAASSGARLKLFKFSGAQLSLHASSGGAVEAEGLSEKALTVASSSGSEVKLTGKADALDLDCSSGSQVEAGRLSAGAVQASGSGGANIEVNATSSIRGHLSAGSHMVVKGAPKVREVATSSGASYDMSGVTEL
jgi:hypothetical protein